jgi:hypothetical protein
MQIIRFIFALIAFLFTIILTIPIFIITLPFWFVKATMWIFTRIFTPKAGEWSDILEYDETVGWKPKPNVNTYYRDLSEQHCHIITGPDGWPGTNTFEDADVIVFGDSFAYGFGIDYDKSYARQLKEPRIKPIGAPGYNMAQAVLLMEQYKEKLRGKVIVWFICLENDLYDNIKPYNSSYNRIPYVCRRNGSDSWGIVRDHIDRGHWFVPNRRREYFAAFAQFCTQSPLANYAYTAAEYLIKEGQKIARSVNAHLVVFTIPQREQLNEAGIRRLISYLPKNNNNFNPDYPDARLNTICNTLNVPFIAGKSFLESSDYLALDPHWNLKGNKKVAQNISDIFNNLSLPGNN